MLPDGASIGLARALEHSVFAPFRAAVGWGEGTLTLRAELRRSLTAKVEDRLEQDRAREVVAENQRLRDLLGFRRRTSERMIPATVVARQRGRIGDLLTVRVSNPEEVRAGMPVLVPEGVLGWSAQPEGDRAIVECLTSATVSVSVLDQRTREEALASWAPGRSYLVLRDVPVQSEWKVGDRVVTSGLGTVFPRGLLIGWVKGVERDPTAPIQRVQVRPAANPAQAEEVFFLLPDTTVQFSDVYPVDPLTGALRRPWSEPIPVP